MPFNGAGLFTRIYQWANDAVLGLNVDSTRTDTDSNDIAAGLSNCVTRDGQSPWLTNIPAGGFKITGLGDGVNPGDSTNYAQVFVNPVFTAPRALATPPVGDNSTLLATTAFATQLAYQAAIPGQALGVFQSDGTVANFAKSLIFGLNFAKAPDVASSASPDIWSGNGNTMHITGTVGFGGLPAAPQPGTWRWVMFDDVLTLTHGANFILPGGINYTTAQGDMALVYADTTTKFYVHLFPADGQQAAPIPYLYVRDEVSSGAGAGNSVSNDITQTRRLQTVVKNTIPGASLAANIITLPAGTYKVSGRVPGVSVSQTKALLYNITDNNYPVIGSSAFAANATVNTTIDSFLRGEFTITATKTFSLRHWTATAVVNGLGTQSGIPAINEVYSELEFWKIL